ncbi:hypothetical protein ACLOJK_028170 [Asimina triloba]
MASALIEMKSMNWLEDARSKHVKRSRAMACFLLIAAASMMCLCLHKDVGGLFKLDEDRLKKDACKQSLGETASQRPSPAFLHFQYCAHFVECECPTTSFGGDFVVHFSNIHECKMQDYNHKAEVNIMHICTSSSSPISHIGYTSLISALCPSLRKQALKEGRFRPIPTHLAASTAKSAVSLLLWEEMDGGDMKISLDKLPIKRLDSIDDNGVERFPPTSPRYNSLFDFLPRRCSEIGYDERRLSQIRRIDFTPLVEKDAKKPKSSKDSEAAATPWPWQSLVENLQLAQQELSVIMDLIHTVEANDAVTVAGMTRPKQLPNELLADLAVSAATKLQCFRAVFSLLGKKVVHLLSVVQAIDMKCLNISHSSDSKHCEEKTAKGMYNYKSTTDQQHLGRYFRQSAKALEQQVARETRFYSALIRLQQNWKVKRQRLAVSALSSDGFTIDLFDTSLLDSAAMFRPSAISTVRVDHDSAGMLTLQLPPNSCHSIQFGFIGDPSRCKRKKVSKSELYILGEKSMRESKKEANDEDVDKCAKVTHSVLREIHRAIFDEQVFDLVNREAFHPSPGVNVNAIREGFIQLGVGQEASVFLSLVPLEQDADQMTLTDQMQNAEDGILPSDGVIVGVPEEKNDDFRKISPLLPNPVGCEIFLKQILHENVFVKAKDHTSAGRTQLSGQPDGDGLSLLGHFCMTLAHRIISKRVMAELENLVSGVPYLHLLTHPTWHSRTSSWSLFVKVPESIIHAGRRTRSTDVHGTKNKVRSQFHIKVVVNGESISVSGEGAPNVVGLFRGRSVDSCLMNQCDSDLADLPLILLQQVASQVICWLHEEALIVGMKASRDFLGLSVQLDQGDILSLVAHVDPNSICGCISWWLVMEDGLMEDGKLNADFSHGGSENRRFLGYLSLETLYSTLMDLVSLCSGSGNY